MEQSRYQLVLGSASPRRKELLAHLRIPFDVVVADLEEKSLKEKCSDVAIDIATQKGEAVFHEVKSRFKNPCVISADTIVVIDEEILGKPQDRLHAKKMLLKLSGRKHEVITAVTFFAQRDGALSIHSFFVSSKVTFDKIAPELLEIYLDTNESLDKAGAYGIQGAALSFISQVDGSYSNVVGFPLSDIVMELKKFLKTDNLQRHFAT